MPLKSREAGKLDPKAKYSELVAALKEGHGSLVDADKVDGKDASELSGIPSNPSINGKKVTNIWWDAGTQQLVFEYDS